MQHALVPQGTQTAGSLTLCSRMTPARELGGDFISIQRHPGGQKLFLAVCDVSGKGVAAALFMAVAQSAIAAAAGKHKDVRAIAAEANATLSAANPLGMFVTGMIAMLDTATGRMDYVIAGHEPPLAVRPGKDLCRLERSGNIPLGLDPGEPYDRFEHRIAPGETIVAYTDGVTDACNPEEQTFGEDRLQELLTGQRRRVPRTHAPADLDRHRPVLGSDGRRATTRPACSSGATRDKKAENDQRRPRVRTHHINGSSLPHPASSARAEGPTAPLGHRRGTCNEPREGECGRTTMGRLPDRNGSPTRRHATGLRPHAPTQTRAEPWRRPTRTGCRPIRPTHARPATPGHRKEPALL